ncbi:MAG: glycosyltransferase [Pseudomonadota bacterium]
MLTVIIPTRNRKKELNNILRVLSLTSSGIDKIIVIDSSDKTLKDKIFFKNSKIVYLHTKIKSAAIQRNIGMSLVGANCKFLAFLDDDVIPGSEYFNQLISTLKKNKAIGVSGLAVNSKKFHKNGSNKLATLYRYIFLLDSKKSGIVLKSGVNIPISFEANSSGMVQTQWLIGCSIWDYNKIRNLRFDNRLFGQSLGEDVIFSLKASKNGPLIVNLSTFLEHTESSKQRPNNFEFYRMWVRNRYYIVKEVSEEKYHPAFHWCNFGKFIILLMFIVKSPTNSLSGLRGMIYGYFDLLKESYAH